MIASIFLPCRSMKMNVLIKYAIRNLNFIYFLLFGKCKYMKQMYRSFIIHYDYMVKTLKLHALQRYNKNILFKIIIGFVNISYNDLLACL